MFDEPPDDDRISFLAATTGSQMAAGLETDLKFMMADRDLGFRLNMDLMERLALRFSTSAASSSSGRKDPARLKLTSHAARHCRACVNQAPCVPDKFDDKKF